MGLKGNHDQRQSSEARILDKKKAPEREKKDKIFMIRNNRTLKMSSIKKSNRETLGGIVIKIIKENIGVRYST